MSRMDYLRRIVSRVKVEEPYRDGLYTGKYFREVLSCGHEHLEFCNFTSRQARIIRGAMQIQNLAKQHVTLKINDGGPVIQGTATDVQGDGVWIALSKDYWLKLVGQGGSGYAGQQLNCFVPFSSMAWLLV
jgi:hypothetical protein